MGDLIFLEVLQGVRDDQEFESVKTKLALLDQYTLFGPDMALKCAENYRVLRKKGVTVRKTNDVIIASFCIDRGMPLLFVDRDFGRFVEWLGLEPAYNSGESTLGFFFN